MGESATTTRLVRRISAEGPVEWYSARTEAGRACLYVRARHASSLVNAVRAHATVDAAECPRLLAHALDDETPWMTLDCDPVGSLEDLASLWPKYSLPYAQAIVVTHTLARVLAAAHRRGELLGALSPSQVLVDRAGRLSVIGLGFDDAAWGPRAFRSARVAMGEAPCPSSDVNASLLFLRAHIPWVTGMPAALARILQGDPGPLERTFAKGLFGAVNQTATIDGIAGLRAIERFWSFLGVSPDREGMAHRLRGTFEEAQVRLAVARDVSWMAVDGGSRHDLVRREPVRRVLRALISAQGTSLTVDDLVQRAWPGEMLVGSSGADRLYVAISTLRKLDLRAAIVREPTGYALRAAVAYHEP